MNERNLELDIIEINDISTDREKKVNTNRNAPWSFFMLVSKGHTSNKNK